MASLQKDDTASLENEIPALFQPQKSDEGFYNDNKKKNCR